MTIEEYIDKARADGKEIEFKHSNGYDYMFIHEDDGWISIINSTGGIYRPMIQAKGIDKAIDYIVRREPLFSGINVI